MREREREKRQKHKPNQRSATRLNVRHRIDPHQHPLEREKEKKREEMNVRGAVISRSKVAAVCGSDLKKSIRFAQRTSVSHRQRFANLRNFAADISDSIDEDAIASGEWPANWSLASYEDVGEYYAGRVLKEEQGHNVSGIMTTNILTAGPTDSSQSLTKLFDHVTGVPVVDSEGVCIGIVSKKDLAKKGKTVSEIMSAPARTITQTNSVGEAATIMLKYKVNRLPVVNKNGSYWNSFKNRHFHCLGKYGGINAHFSVLNILIDRLF